MSLFHMTHFHKLEVFNADGKRIGVLWRDADEPIDFADVRAELQSMQIDLDDIDARLTAIEQRYGGE